MKKILLLGATGTAGSAISKKLLSELRQGRNHARLDAG